MKLHRIEKSHRKEANAKGLTYEMMMENAGSAHVILEMDLAEEDERQALALVGQATTGMRWSPAQLAAQSGIRGRTLSTARSKMTSHRARGRGQIVLASEDESFDMLRAFMETSHVLLDGVLGTGIKLPLKGEVAVVLAAASEAISGWMTALRRRGGLSHRSGL
jgi:NAD(P)H-hydrate epimerase